MASRGSVSGAGAKRGRYCLPLRKPITVHQNIRIIPAPGYDEEGKLPDSLPPSPVIDLVTESETEVEERTPRRRPQFMPPPPSLNDLNPTLIEREDEGRYLQPLPVLQPLRRGGKNMAMVLASIRDADPSTSPQPDLGQLPGPSTSRSPVQSPVQEPQPGPSTRYSPVSPVLVLREQPEDVLLFVEAEARRLEQTKVRIGRAVPNLRVRLDESRIREAEIRTELIALENRLNQEMAMQQRCQAALLSIDNFFSK